MIFGYGAPIAALTIHDNAIDFTVMPNAPNETGSTRASVSFTPTVPYYQLETSVYSVGFKGGCDERLSYRRAAGSKNFRITGDIAPDAMPCRQAIAILDPAEYAAQALKLALEHRGVHINGSALARHYDDGLLGGVHAERPDYDPTLQLLFDRALPAEPTNCQAQPIMTSEKPVLLPRTLLASHRSPTLLEDVIYTNKVSQNQHAELLLRTPWIRLHLRPHGTRWSARHPRVPSTRWHQPG